MTQPQAVKAEAPQPVKPSSPKSPKPSATTPGAGHNTGIAGAQLKSILQHLERLDEDKRAVGEDIKEVYAEAKGNGLNPKIIRKLLRIQMADKAKLSEENQLLGLYGSAVGIDPFS